jgi:hypothetical protein
MSTASRRWRHVLVGAVIAGLAIVPAQAFGARSISPKAKKAIRAELRKAVKKNPSVIRRRAFLRKAALVNFSLPVTIRLRNPCTTENGANPAPTVGGNPVGVALSTNCLTQGTALNERTLPSAKVNLGPSLGTRDVAVGGSLAGVVQFNDTYDGGALGNVSIKILPSTKKFLTTSSVPLLWNDDLADPAKRADATFLKATSFLTGLSETGVEQGCGDFASSPTPTGGIVPAGYNAVFHGYTPAGFGFPTAAGIPGYPYYDPAGPGGTTTPAGYFPSYPGVDGIDQIKVGGVVGNNDWIGLNSNPFPTGSAPTNSGNPSAPLPFNYNAPNTVLRTNALHLAIAPGGVSVNMSTGTATSPGGLTTAQGSQDITLGYSGGQANLFGNIPGKNVGIDVTVNLKATINGIARITDQDQFTSKLISGNNYQAGMFNCHQVWTQAVQNYIPGVRLTGSLRIAPAITKDGKVRIAKATVQSDVNNPDRVALTACLTAESAYVEYNDEPPGVPGSPFGFSDRNTVSRIPYFTTSGTPTQFPSGLWPVDSDVLPVFQNLEKFPPDDPAYNQFGGNAPSTQPCNTEPYALVRDAGFTGTVGGLPTPTDPAFAGVNYNGSQATVAGDISVNPLDVDVLLGDQ